MSNVLYVRAPDSVKEAVDEYKDHRGTTLSSAVVDLLERGLGAVSDERSIADLEASLARVRADKVKLEASLQSSKTELAALHSFAQRASRAVGTCPKCKAAITGYDLLGAGQCRECGTELTSLVAPKGATGLDDRELMILLGALAAVLGIAYLTSK